MELILGILLFLAQDPAPEPGAPSAEQVQQAQEAGTEPSAAEPAPEPAAETQEPQDQDPKPPRAVPDQILEVGASLEQSRIDLVPPAGALGGAWMLPPGQISFRFEESLESYEGLRDGSRRVPSSEVLASWASSVPSAERAALAVTLVRGVTDRISVSASVPFEERRSEWRTAGGATGTEIQRGLGDVELHANFRVRDQEREQLVLGYGLLAPTGAHDRRGNWGGLPSSTLPYWLQLGGGTWQFVGTASFLQDRGSWSWGAGARGQAPWGENDEGWARERSLLVDLWAARRVSESMVLSLRALREAWSDVRGSATVDESLSPLHDNGRLGGERVSLLAGLSFDLSQAGEVGTNRLEFELGGPLLEDLDGPGLAAEARAFFRWRLGF